MRSLQLLLFPIALCVIATSFDAGAETSPSGDNARAQRTEELTALRARIQSMQQQLNAVQGRRHTVREELSQVDRTIGQRVAALRRLDRQHKSDQHRLRQLERRAQREAGVLQDQRAALSDQARATFILGQQEYLKILLNQQDPARAARTLTYYRYFNEARVARISTAREKLAHLAALERDIREHGDALARLRREQTQQKDAMEADQARRRRLLATLDREVSDRAQAIERLKQDEARLERLLQQLEQVLPPLPGDFPKDGRFADQRGRLPLPVVGHIRATFGEPKKVGTLKWRGVLVDSPAGSDVRAVFRGRVAYADWLRGFGLLLILDHGNGYMTLYGHNQGLYKEVGEWVEGGEIIAAVGATGDTTYPGVYFEVRQNGKPRDPLQWCSRHGRARSAQRRRKR